MTRSRLQGCSANAALPRGLRSQVSPNHGQHNQPGSRNLGGPRADPVEDPKEELSASCGRPVVDMTVSTAD